MNSSAVAESLDADRTYSTPDVCRLAGLSFRTVDYWCRRGVIVPEREANGSGSSRRFTAEQVQAFRLAAALRRLGVDLDRIAGLLAVARDLPEGVSLVWTGSELEHVLDEDMAAIVRRSGGAAVVVAP